MTDTEHGFEPKCSCKCGHVAMGPWHSPGRCAMYVGALDLTVTDTERPTYDELADAVLSLDKLTCPTHTRLFGGDSFQTFAAHCVECRTIVKVQALAERLRMIGADE